MNSRKNHEENGRLGFYLAHEGLQLNTEHNYECKQLTITPFFLKKQFGIKFDYRNSLKDDDDLLLVVNENPDFLEIINLSQHEISYKIESDSVWKKFSQYNTIQVKESARAEFKICRDVIILSGIKKIRRKANLSVYSPIKQVVRSFQKETPPDKNRSLESSRSSHKNSNNKSISQEANGSQSSDFTFENLELIERLLESAKRERMIDENKSKEQRSEDKRSVHNEDISTNEPNSDGKKMIIEEIVSSSNNIMRQREYERDLTSDDSFDQIPLKKKKKINDRLYLTREFSESGKKNNGNNFLQEQLVTDGISKVALGFSDANPSRSPSTKFIRSNALKSPPREALTPKKLADSDARKKKRKLQIADSSDSQHSDFNSNSSKKSPQEIKSSTKKEELMSVRRDLKRLKKVLGSRKERKALGNSQEEEETCAICLGEVRKDDMGVLECKHIFCIECIKDWAAVTNTCPLCKQEFHCIKRKQNDEEDIIPVQQKRQIYQENIEDLIIDETDDKCYKCFNDDNTHVMLVCDRCLFYCCHIYCCEPPLDSIPSDDWICDFCRHEDESDSDESDLSERGDPLQSLVQQRQLRRQNQQQRHSSNRRNQSNRNSNVRRAPAPSENTRTITTQQAQRNINQPQRGRTNQGRARPQRESQRRRRNAVNSFTYGGNISDNRGNTRNQSSSSISEENQRETRGNRANRSRAQNTRTNNNPSSRIPVNQGIQLSSENNNRLRTSRNSVAQQSTESRALNLRLVENNRRTAMESLHSSPKSDDTSDYRGRSSGNRIQVARRATRIIASGDEGEDVVIDGSVVEKGNSSKKGAQSDSANKENEDSANKLRASGRMLDRENVNEESKINSDDKMEYYLTAEELLEFFSDTNTQKKIEIPSKKPSPNLKNPSSSDNSPLRKSPPANRRSNISAPNRNDEYSSKREEDSPVKFHYESSPRKSNISSPFSKSSEDNILDVFKYNSNKSKFKRKDEEERSAHSYSRTNFGTGWNYGRGTNSFEAKGQKNKNNIERNNSKMSDFIIKCSRNMSNKF